MNWLNSTEKTSCVDHNVTEFEQKHAQNIHGLYLVDLFALQREGLCSEGCAATPTAG